MKFDPIPFTPKNPLLREFISYYYFLQTKDDGFEQKYYAFPHIATVLNIHRKANFEINGNYTRVFSDANTAYIACVQGIRENPLLAHLQGDLDKVTILFKPLGINQFGLSDFGKTYTQPSEIFTSWDSQPAYHDFLNQFYGVTDIEQRIEILETFLLKMYQPVEQNNLLYKAIDLLTQFEENRSIEEICKVLEVNVRTLNRAFKRSLNVSPVAYRKVARFRNSMQQKILSSSVQRLADVAYESNYYDPAYFNKIYRSLTGSNPQRFFNKINSLANNQLILQMMEL